MKKARIFLKAFLDVLGCVLALAAGLAFVCLGGSLYGVTGFISFGLIEVFSLIVWAHYDELKGREI